MHRDMPLSVLTFSAPLKEIRTCPNLETVLDRRMKRVILCFAFLLAVASSNKTLHKKEEVTSNTALQTESDCSCQNGFCTTDNDGKTTCSCPAEYGLLKPDYCEECDCGEGANCTFDDTLFLNGKECICPRGYKEAFGKCESLCAEKPCLNGGKCWIRDDDYFCNCRKAFIGKDCEQECDCGSRAYDCEISAEGKKQCYCSWGNKVVNGTCVDVCEGSPCLNGGTCGPAGEGIYGCKCGPKHSGPNCEYECYCGDNSHSCSRNITGEKVCHCERGYSQFNGTCRAECRWEFECFHGGNCSGWEDGATFCSCEDYYSGDKCEVDDICDSAEWRRKCHKMDATCRRVGRNARCECEPPKQYDWIAQSCQYSCNSQNCIHGTCYIYVNDTFCNCNDRYTGHRCDQYIGPLTVTDYTPSIIILVVLAVLIVIMTIVTIVIASKTRKLKKAITKP